MRTIPLQVGMCFRVFQSQMWGDPAAEMESFPLPWWVVRMIGRRTLQRPRYFAKVSKGEAKTRSREARVRVYNRFHIEMYAMYTNTSKRLPGNVKSDAEWRTIS